MVSVSAAFESGYALLKDVGGGVHDAGVDVAELLEREETTGVVRVLEEIRGGLIDGHGARAGGRVRGLAGVDGLRGKLLRFWFRHNGLLRVLVVDALEDGGDDNGGKQ
jgi:hypothetical protein